MFIRNRYFLIGVLVVLIAGMGVWLLRQKSASVPAPAPAAVSSSGDPDTTENLIGIWQAAPSLGDGWDTYYQFFANGKYNYRAAAGQCALRERGYSGTWTFAEHAVTFNRQKVAFLDGGTEQPAEDTDGCVSKTKIVGGHVTYGSVDAGKSGWDMLIDVCSSEDQDASPAPCLLFDGVPYYRMSADPTYDGSPDVEKEI